MCHLLPKNSIKPKNKVLETANEYLVCFSLAFLTLYQQQLIDAVGSVPSVLNDHFLGR